MKKKVRSPTRPQGNVLPILQTGMKKLLICFKGGRGGEWFRTVSELK